MSKQHKRRQHRHPAPAASRAVPFTPVPVRARHDGWTPARQVAFVQALAACGHIEEACAAVGKSPRSFYDLRARADSGSFRQAVDLALDQGVTRLEDAMLGRALHGVVEPIFYKGEQVGERRRYDERLALALLRARRPERYGKWRDGMQCTREDPDAAAKLLKLALRDLAEAASALAAGRPAPDRPPLKRERLMDDPEEIALEERRQAERERRREQEDEERREAEWQAYLETLEAQTHGTDAPPSPGMPADDARAPDDAPDGEEEGRSDDHAAGAGGSDQPASGEPTLADPPPPDTLGIDPFGGNDDPLHAGPRIT